jgi:hypothetical protein
MYENIQKMIIKILKKNVILIKCKLNENKHLNNLQYHIKY